MVYNGENRQYLDMYSGDFVDTSIDSDSHVNGGKPWIWLMATQADATGEPDQEAWLHLTPEEAFSLGNRLINLAAHIEANS